MRDEMHETERVGGEGSDVLLPSQLVQLPAQFDRVPEARLALAVLEDAVVTLQLATRVRTPRARMLAAHAATWILSDDSTEPFAFVALCDYLGLDATWLRQGLRRAGLLGAPPRRLVVTTDPATARSRTLHGRGDNAASRAAVRVDRPACR